MVWYHSIPHPRRRFEFGTVDFGFENIGTKKYKAYSHNYHLYNTIYTHNGTKVYPNLGNREAAVAKLFHRLLASGRDPWALVKDWGSIGLHFSY